VNNLGVCSIEDWIPEGRNITPLGTGEKLEKQEDPLIMLEPFWPYFASGVILVLGGLIKGIIALRNPDFPNLTTNVALGVAIVLVVCGILILKHFRDAGWVVLIVVFVNLVIAESLPGNKTDGFLGEYAIVAVLVAVLQFIIFGLAGIAPLVLGLKRGMAGKY
jgi:hypothetical protein